MLKYPWVFWITIRRRQWFKKFYYTRGANFLDVQIFGLLISFGAPFSKTYIRHGGNGIEPLDAHIKRVNDSFLSNRRGIKIPAIHA